MLRSRPFVFALALACCAPAVGVWSTSPAEASVALYLVTPDNVATTDGISVEVTRDAIGTLTFTLTLAPAGVAVYPVEVQPRDGAAREAVEWVSVDDTAYVAEVEVAAVDADSAVITVLRDDGLVGYRYEVRAADWAP